MARKTHAEWGLLLCLAVFAAAVLGAVICGEKMAGVVEDAARARHLRLLIYAHFAMAQAAIAVAVSLLYLRHRAWRRYYLIVSYNEKGMQIDPPGVTMPPGRVYRCHLRGGISAEDLPPDGAPVLVYPMFMLSGRSSGEKLEEALRVAYSTARRTPRLFFQPVLGASPWLAQATAEYLRGQLKPGVGVLIVAHGSEMPEPPPEPALYCRRLRELLPTGTELRLGYFGQDPEAREVLRTMEAREVLLLPFLLTEGVHSMRDLPTEQDAAACGKELRRLPVVAQLLRQTREA